MKSDEIRAKLNHWSFPRGPFRPVEQIYREMEMNARCMGPKAAPELAQILVQLDEEGDPLIAKLLYLFYKKTAISVILN